MDRQLDFSRTTFDYARGRSPSPITCFHRPIAASTLERQL
jgi:hypothetical protein